MMTHEPDHPFATWYGTRQEHEECWRRIRQGVYDAIYLATPPGVSGELLPDLADSGPRTIAVEKPWFGSFAAARRAAPRLRRAPACVRFIDHYLHRGAVRWLLGQPLTYLLGGPPTAVSGWLLESSEPASPAMGVGVLPDLLLHLLTVTRRLLPGRRFRVLGAAAARYNGAPSDAETFARVTFDAGLPVTLSAAKAYPTETAGKMLVVHGRDAQLRIDLARDTINRVTARWSERLFPGDAGPAPDPYEHLLQQLAAGERDFGLDLREALAVLRLLDRARRSFPDPLPAYARGDHPPAD